MSYVNTLYTYLLHLTHNLVFDRLNYRSQLHHPLPMEYFFNEKGIVPADGYFIDTDIAGCYELEGYTGENLLEDIESLHDLIPDDDDDTMTCIDIVLLGKMIHKLKNSKSGNDDDLTLANLNICNLFCRLTEPYKETFNTDNIIVEIGFFKFRTDFLMNCKIAIERVSQHHVFDWGCLPISRISSVEPDPRMIDYPSAVIRRFLDFNAVEWNYLASNHNKNILQPRHQKQVSKKAIKVASVKQNVSNDNKNVTGNGRRASKRKKPPSKVETESSSDDDSANNNDDNQKMDSASRESDATESESPGPDQEPPKKRQKKNTQKRKKKMTVADLPDNAIKHRLRSATRNKEKKAENVQVSSDSDENTQEEQDDEEIARQSHPRGRRPNARRGRGGSSGRKGTGRGRGRGRGGKGRGRGRGGKGRGRGRGGKGRGTNATRDSENDKENDNENKPSEQDEEERESNESGSENSASNDDSDEEDDDEEEDDDINISKQKQDVESAENDNQHVEQSKRKSNKNVKFTKTDKLEMENDESENESDNNDNNNDNSNSNDDNNNDNSNNNDDNSNSKRSSGNSSPETDNGNTHEGSSDTSDYEYSSDEKNEDDIATDGGTKIDENNPHLEAVMIDDGSPDIINIRHVTPAIPITKKSIDRNGATGFAGSKIRKSYYTLLKSEWHCDALSGKFLNFNIHPFQIGLQSKGNHVGRWEVANKIARSVTLCHTTKRKRSAFGGKRTDIVKKIDKKFKKYFGYHCLQTHKFFTGSYQETNATKNYMLPANQFTMFHVEVWMRRGELQLLRRWVHEGLREIGPYDPPPRIYAEETASLAAQDGVSLQAANMAYQYTIGMRYSLYLALKNKKIDFNTCEIDENVKWPLTPIYMTAEWVRNGVENDQKM